MDSKARHRLRSKLKDSRSWTLAAPVRTQVVQAARITQDDWRLTFEGTRSLADRLEAVVQAAADEAQGTCRTVGRPGRSHVRLELGCRGPQLLASLIEAVIDDHAAGRPRANVMARLQVDDSMRPRRIDVVVPSGSRLQSEGTLLGMYLPGSAQPV